jgi:hypothetical protein
VDDGPDRDIYFVAWPATFLLHGQSSGIVDSSIHAASLSVFRGWGDITEVIAPASPVRLVKSLESKMGAAIHTIPPRIQTLCSKTRAHCRESFQSYTMKPLSNTEGEFMANLKGLAGFVSKLRTVRTNLVSELRHVDAALSVLGKLKGVSNSNKLRHTMSASVRRRMSLAQKARWAKAKGHAPKPKRTMSASARRKIAAEQKARWAKIRAGKKG